MLKIKKLLGIKNEDIEDNKELSTEEIIIVEGITSKMRIDCELELYHSSKIKSCCTFGKKITEIQLLKIKNKGQNVKRIILFYLNHLHLYIHPLHSCSYKKLQKLYQNTQLFFV